MPTDNRSLTIPDKLKVVMEVQEYLCLSPEQFRQLLLHVIKTNLKRQETLAHPHEDDLKAKAA